MNNHFTEEEQTYGQNQFTKPSILERIALNYNAMITDAQQGKLTLEKLQQYHQERYQLKKEFEEETRQLEKLIKKSKELTTWSEEAMKCYLQLSKPSKEYAKNIPTQHHEPKKNTHESSS